MPKRGQNKRNLQKKHRTGVLRLRYYLNIYLLAKDIGVEQAAKVLGLDANLLLGSEIRKPKLSY